MENSGPDKKADAASPPAESSWVRLLDGAKTELRTLRCADAAAPVVMILPALGVPARFYARFAAALVEAGCHAALHDLRGIGTSDQRAGRHVDFGYETLVLSDLPAVIAQVKQCFPAAPIVLLGHSLGGHLSLMYVGWTQDPAVRGVALVASGAPYVASFAWRERLQLMIAGQLFPTVAKLFGYYPGEFFRFGGREARRLITQWAAVVNTGRFGATSADGIGAEEALSRVERPVLAVTIAGDRLAPRESMETLLRKIPRASIERWYYEPGAGSPEADHFRWTKQSPAIVSRVAAFARKLPFLRDSQSG